MVLIPLLFVGFITFMTTMVFTAPTTTWWERELIAPGRYDATMYSLVDLWTQEVEYQWEKKSQRKVLFWFEIHWQEITYKDRETGEEVTRPKVKTKKYTLTMSDKGNLYKDLNSRLGRPPSPWFDLESLLWKKCTLKIVHKKSTKWDEYAIIDYIDMSEHNHELQNEKQLFNFANFSEDSFESLYDRQKNIIRETPEYKQAISILESEDDLSDEDMPF